MKAKSSRKVYLLMTFGTSGEAHDGLLYHTEQWNLVTPFPGIRPAAVYPTWEAINNATEKWSAMDYAICATIRFVYLRSCVVALKFLQQYCLYQIAIYSKHTSGMAKESTQILWTENILEI